MRFTCSPSFPNEGEQGVISGLQILILKTFGLQIRMDAASCRRYINQNPNGRMGEK